MTGLVIHMEEKRTLVRLPQDRYDEVQSIIDFTLGSELIASKKQLQISDCKRIAAGAYNFVALA